MIHILVGRATGEATLSLLHLGHFLLGLGFRNDLVKVLIGVVKYDDRSGDLLLSFIHHLK